MNVNNTNRRSVQAEFIFRHKMYSNQTGSCEKKGRLFRKSTIWWSRHVSRQWLWNHFGWLRAVFQIAKKIWSDNLARVGSRLVARKKCEWRRHGVIAIDHSFLSNRLHFDYCTSNRRLLSPLNVEIFTLHCCAMNRGYGDWVSSFIIACYGFVLFQGRIFTLVF